MCMYVYIYIYLSSESNIINRIGGSRTPLDPKAFRP